MKAPIIYRNALAEIVFSRLVYTIGERLPHDAHARERFVADVGNSTWYDLTRPPRSIVEESLRALCTVVDPSCSCAGVEWWIRIAPATEGKVWHFDKDEQIAKTLGKVVHPEAAAILYLNAVGGATIVSDQTTVAPEMVNGKEQYSPAQPSFVLSVSPASNQFLAFPGHLRHRVLPEARDQGTRMTLLSNWWLAEPLGLEGRRRCELLEYAYLENVECCSFDNHHPEELPAVWRRIETSSMGDQDT